MNDLKKIISSRIRRLLEKNNIKQKELAHYLNVSDNTVSYYCNGTRIPNLEQMKKIAVFFDTTVDFLVGLTNVESTETDIKSICDYIGLTEDAVDTIMDIRYKHPELIECFNIFICNDNLYSLLIDINNYASHYSMNSANKEISLIQFVKDKKLDIDITRIKKRGVHALSEEQKNDFQAYEVKRNLKYDIVYNDTDYDIYKAQKELARCLDEGTVELFNPECMYYTKVEPNTKKIIAFNPFTMSCVVNHVIDLENKESIDDNGNDNEEK